MRGDLTCAGRNSESFVVERRGTTGVTDADRIVKQGSAPNGSPKGVAILAQGKSKSPRVSGNTTREKF